MYNASDRKDIRRAEREAKATAELNAEFIRLSMQSRSGRAWFHRLLSDCHIFDGSFTGDALLEAFSKGQRNVGLRIYSDILAYCPDLFVMMMQEANAKEVINARRSDAEQPRGEDADGGIDSTERDATTEYDTTHGYE